MSTVSGLGVSPLGTCVYMIRCGQHPGVNLKFIHVSHKPILLAYTLCALTVAYYVRSLLVLRKLCKSVWGWSACGGLRVSKPAPRVRGVLTCARLLSHSCWQRRRASLLAMQKSGTGLKLRPERKRPKRSPWRGPLKKPWRPRRKSRGKISSSEQTWKT